MKQKEPCAQPCASCPWLRKNQTEEAIRESPIDGRDRHWFERENLERHWRAVGAGQMMPCHATDKNAPMYGGKTPSKKAKARICVGLTILARREVTAFMESGTDFSRYSERPGIRMSLQGLAAWASRLYYAGATFLVGNTKLQMPVVEENDDVTLPSWED